MSSKKMPLKERGSAIWVSAPVKRSLEARLAERAEELGRLVTVSEVIEQLLERQP